MRRYNGGQATGHHSFFWLQTRGMGRMKMSDVTGSSASVTQQLTTFDEARDHFLTAFAQAPDEALPFVPPGDEYAIGVLPIHLLDPITRYMTVFDQITANEYELV